MDTPVSVSPQSWERLDESRVAYPTTHSSESYPYLGTALLQLDDDAIQERSHRPETNSETNNRRGKKTELLNKPEGKKENNGRKREANIL
ncbi:hypothetical protein KQX54_002825 [Cotesia glomerata]|uniref:Uncharacterized protein n=1 Tax=Cotesia glomerata TaxID=32391 RepID=A0AAV7IWX5_COTGL|nr:hypothetical protein KQX54_002825 [Cotesia glomerata]